MADDPSQAQWSRPDAGRCARGTGRRWHACRAMSARNRYCWRAPASEVFAVAAQCSHYHGPLAEGLVVGDTVRCPWHHACFSLRTGEALRAPALSPIDCWSVEQRDGKIFVTGKRSDVKPAPRGKPAATPPGRIVIVGGGAAGFAAAEMLRRQDYKGSIVMLSNDDAAPRRSPQPVQGLPGRQRARGMDSAARRRLLLRQRHRAASQGQRRGHRPAQRARWSSPMAARLPTTGCCWRPARSRCGCRFPAPTSRMSTRCARLADSRAIVERAKTARRAVVIGASFIGLEVGGLPARPRARGPCRGAGEAADGARPGARDGRLRARAARGARRRLPSRGHGGRHRRQAGQAEERRHARGRSRRHGRRRAAAARPCREGGARHRSRRRRRRAFSRPARPASSPPATSRAGPIRTAARRSASSTGWSPSARARPRR